MDVHHRQIGFDRRLIRAFRPDPAVRAHRGGRRVRICDGSGSSENQQSAMKRPTPEGSSRRRPTASIASDCFGDGCVE